MNTYRLSPRCRLNSCSNTAQLPSTSHLPGMVLSMPILSLRFFCHCWFLLLCLSPGRWRNSPTHVVAATPLSVVGCDDAVIEHDDAARQRRRQRHDDMGIVFDVFDKFVSCKVKIILFYIKEKIMSFI